MNAERDRDRAMEGLLPETLRADAGVQASEGCLDAETLAAWMDGGLDAPALALVEAHAAGCARCQAMVGVITRTIPTVSAPASWWQRHRQVRWLVPLGAGAAAVALWTAVPERRQPGAPLIQSAPVEARTDVSAPATAEATAPAPAPAALPPMRPGAAAPAPVVRPQTAQGATAFSKDVAVAPSQAEGPARLEAPRAVESLALRAEDQLAAAPPAQRAAPPAAPAAPAPGSLRRQQAGAPTAPLEIVSPDPAVRWRLGARGVVEYSASGGAAWESLSTGIAAELTAGSSPSATVCWLVGRGGTILLATDGRHWQRVPFADAADLASVAAIDARTASVTTTDGRIFRTSDAGQTWQR